MSAFFSRLFFLSAFLFLNQFASAQDEFFLALQVEPGNEKLLSQFKREQSFPDSLSLRRTLREYISVLHEEGYFLASVEDIKFNKDKVTARLIAGERFEWLGLREGNLTRSLIRRIGYRPTHFESKPFRYREIARLERQLLDYAEQNGHPFASLSFDSLEIDGQRFAGAFNFDAGPPITFDSIHVEGNTRTKSQFIGHYLGITLGQPYDQRKIDNLSRAINNLPYLRLSESPSLTFQNSEATLTLKLEDRRINQVDGIIGFLPNASDDNKLLVTGQFDLELYSPFGRGRAIGIHWQKLNTNSQNLDMEYEQPNVFKGPLDFVTDFSFLKEDSLFTNRNLRIEFDYRLNASSSFSVFSNLKTTNLLATSIYENNTQLPDLVDFDFTSYGVKLEWQQLDDAFLPKKGTRIFVEGSAGNKKIIQNNGISAELYQGIERKTFQYTLNVSGEKYWNLGNQLVLLSRLRAGQVFNDRLFRNDAYRLGGFNSVRGFNENFFFATSYSFLTTEARFFLDEFSYLSLFSDLAWLRSRFDDINTTQTPIGFGAGISFSTNSGIFNFVYALGSSGDQGGINLSQSKIHFGFTSRF